MRSGPLWKYDDFFRTRATVVGTCHFTSLYPNLDKNMREKRVASVMGMPTDGKEVSALWQYQTVGIR